MGVSSYKPRNGITELQQPADAPTRRVGQKILNGNENGTKGPLQRFRIAGKDGR
ncbi:hypothetical protein [Longibacter sp.]|uniref:hypothetical protein n=1 Tax=Longibacter sp. TaxID=2045415 RepID=UPI003EBF049D